MFFRLLPEVYLIIGKHKSLLQNIITKRAFWVDNSIGELIKLCENNEHISDEFLKYAKGLEENEWGKITTSPIFVEKLRLVNFSDKRQIHKKAPIVNHATIKLTDECNLNCDRCRQIFCPTCIKDGNCESLNLIQIKIIITNIEYYGCKTLVLTGGEIALFQHLKEVYTFAKEKGLNVILNTNGIKKLDDFFVNSNILISVFSSKDMDAIINNYKDFKNITVIQYFNSDKKFVIPLNWKLVNRSSFTHKITKNSLLNMYIDKFHLRRSKNTCLDGKIVINQMGDVYPCLEAVKSKQTAGNIYTQSFKEVIKNLSDNFWDEKIDNNKICCKCEFRYACNSCMFDNVEKNCHYDMEGKIWR